jgi:phosphate-selective porin OprO and OprP
MRRFWPLIALMTLVVVPRSSRAQEQMGAPVQSSAEETDQSPASAIPASPDQPQSAHATLINTEEAGESDEIEIPRKLKNWNEYEGPHFTVRAGGGLLYEFAGYSQDKESKQQFALDRDFKLRDFRFLLRGSFPSLNRNVTWSTGIMYDAPTHSWLMRETGVMFQLPKSWGYVFIGRTKEGFSLNKVMVGYAGWTMERATMNDATVPILADGIKWIGYSHGFVWNLGWYHDVFSHSQSFSTYSGQTVGRVAWLPIHSEEDETLLHLGVNLRDGTPENDQLQLRSRPEAFPAPYFVDTGKFEATRTRMAGYEAYYRVGPWMLGSEYWFQFVSSPSTRNPVFRGGDIVTTWVLTGETRPYNTVGGYFKAVTPSRPVFVGGPGAWELVFRFSSIDLNGGTLRGGKFWRFTPDLNWYLSREVRWSFAYGYGELDRFKLRGNTQFFQTRVQLQF